MNEVERVTEYVLQWLLDGSWVDYQTFDHDNDAIKRCLYLREHCKDSQYRVIERVTIDNRMNI